MARQSISKKLRFEVFKRDSFTCQYCGKQPPEVPLVVDHINPVANGGDNDPLNLITSCEPCNQGKGARVLNIIPSRPDADLEWLEMQQELAELRRYQLLKQQRDELKMQIVGEFQNLWWSLVDEETAPSDHEILGWLTWSDPNQIEHAIHVTASRTYKLGNFRAKLKYCAGVLHNLQETGK